jgi:hypothetical protein
MADVLLQGIKPRPARSLAIIMTEPTDHVIVMNTMSSNEALFNAHFRCTEAGLVYEDSHKGILL